MRDRIMLWDSRSSRSKESHSRFFVWILFSPPPLSATHRSKKKKKQAWEIPETADTPLSERTDFDLFTRRRFSRSRRRKSVEKNRSASKMIEKDVEQYWPRGVLSMAQNKYLVGSVCLIRTKLRRVSVRKRDERNEARQRMKVFTYSRHSLIHATHGTVYYRKTGPSKCGADGVCARVLHLLWYWRVFHTSSHFYRRICSWVRPRSQTLSETSHGSWGRRIRAFWFPA